MHGSTVVKTRPYWNNLPVGKTDKGNPVGNSVSNADARRPSWRLGRDSAGAGDAGGGHADDGYGNDDAGADTSPDYIRPCLPLLLILSTSSRTFTVESKQKPYFFFFKGEWIFEKFDFWASEKSAGRENRREFALKIKKRIDDER